MSLWNYKTNSLAVNVGLCMVSALGAYRGWNIGINRQTEGNEYKPKHLQKKPLYTLSLFPAGVMAGFYGLFPAPAVFFEAVALEDKLRNGENK